MNKFNSYSDYLHQKKPSELCHYTSYEALNNIVKQGGKLSFWVTEISYLNDHQEFFHGFDFLKKAYEKLKKENLENARVTRFLNTLSPFFIFSEGVGSSLIFSQNSGVFVLSFTHEKDLLSQWRAYTPNCHGVSISVEPNFRSSHSNNSLLYPVIYNDKFKSEYAEHILKLGIDKCVDFTEANSFINQKVSSEVIMQMKAACTLMKDSSFSEESEWRYVVYGEKHDNIYLRSSEYYLIPYVELKIENECFKQIVIGPNPHSELSKKSIELLLSKSGLQKVNVVKSTIPYRG
ncbi:DUF2971 domain-containing protein [Pseudoalteromonas sp. FUC4]|uniref:DUF2971 domain-containing protein n=1 Tax=Pseudoalteromonas sp. FUC4 TaxID=2511201 RepID=UPI0011F16B03|nr:DUF2971 domain-containing protein [Pseudoalteromonas sp. FUC4]KAA1153941.1 DUF2971 domain-containing protein [Pseudoalteromonas sp. FUC4]